ncbi:MAG: imidazole glycerol phosphate synthase subunit HisH [Microthrixaceae bacterium]
MVPAPGEPVGAPDDRWSGDESGPRIAVLDYGIGNLRSAEKALEHVGARAILTADPEQVRVADGVVLPGVGAFGRCREALASAGLDAVALDAVASGRPFLGICVGMQLLYESSEESPGVAGLGVLPGTVRRLPDGVKHPQMQWNQLDPLTESELFEGLDERPWMYFVHSFAPDRTQDTIATCDYGGPVTAAAARDNVLATQFHPEKSGDAGLQLLRNFVGMVERSRRELDGAVPARVGDR